MLQMSKDSLKGTDFPLTQQQVSSASHKHAGPDPVPPRQPTSLMQRDKWRIWVPCIRRGGVH